MSTKAQRFKAAVARSGPKKKKTPKKAKTRDPGHTDTRNVTKRGDKRSGPALEDSESGRPSRKSTRPGVKGGRTDTAKMRATKARKQTPKARAGRALAGRK